MRSEGVYGLKARGKAEMIGGRSASQAALEGVEWKGQGNDEVEPLKCNSKYSVSWLWVAPSQRIERFKTASMATPAAVSVSCSRVMPHGSH
jgi:hypothetical protein